MARPRPRSVLISRREALLTAPARAVSAFDEVYAFRSGLEPESEDPEESLPPLAGLHAKIFVIDDGQKSLVGVGSANATSAALGHLPRNVEFMVELVGRKSKCGIDALLSPPRQGESGTFSTLIEPFDPKEAGTTPEDETGTRLDNLLNAASRGFGTGQAHWNCQRQRRRSIQACGWCSPSLLSCRLTYGASLAGPQRFQLHISGPLRTAWSSWTCRWRSSRDSSRLKSGPTIDGKSDGKRFCTHDSTRRPSRGPTCPGSSPTCCAIATDLCDCCGSCCRRTRMCVSVNSASFCRARVLGWTGASCFLDCWSECSRPWGAIPANLTT